MKRRLARIKAVVCDVDGVLTDGGLYFSARGHEMKRFHARDGLAVRLLQKMGIAVAFVTGDSAPIARTRAKILDIPLVLDGLDDKLAGLRKVAREFGVTLDEIAYLGDDLPDVPALKAAGFSAAPFDAAPEARRAAKMVTRARGGRGALREVVDLLRRSR